MHCLPSGLSLFVYITNKLIMKLFCAANSHVKLCTVSSLDYSIVSPVIGTVVTSVRNISVCYIDNELCDFLWV